jgi:hypothetical protein
LKHILEEPTLATKYLITSAQHSFRMKKTDFAWKFKDTSEIIELLHPRNQAQCPTQVFENQNYILKIIIIFLVKTNRLWVFSIQLLKTHKKKIQYMNDVILTY